MEYSSGVHPGPGLFASDIRTDLYGVPYGQQDRRIIEAITFN